MTRPCLLSLVAALALAPAVRAQDSTKMANPGPAPFVNPVPGATLLYSGGLTQTIDSVRGIRTFFTDNAHNQGATVGLFIIDNPKNPRTVDEKALNAFWPLKLGNKATVAISQGQERWETTLRVVGADSVKLPAGKFATYVVEGVQAPKLVKNPKTPTIVTTWWYSPALGAVARFATTVSAGSPNAGKIRRFELLNIRAPRSAPR